MIKGPDGKKETSGPSILLVEIKRGYLFGCKSVCFQHFSWFISVKEFFLKPKYMNICF